MDGSLYAGFIGEWMKKFRTRRKEKMKNVKKVAMLAMAAMMTVSVLAGCSKEPADNQSVNDDSDSKQVTEISGTVSTDGSTSM